MSVPSGSPHGLQRDKSATELVRALLIVNGGGAAALLVFLQAIWKSDPLLAKSTVWAVVSLGVGAFCAAAFHLLRYESSWYHGNGQMTLWWIFRKFYLSAAIASLVAFAVGTAVLAVGAFRAIPITGSSEDLGSRLRQECVAVAREVHRTQWDWAHADPAANAGEHGRISVAKQEIDKLIRACIAKRAGM